MASRSAALLAGLAALAAAATAAGQDYVPVRETAVAETERKAMHEAYYAALQRVLLKVVGYQAHAEVGSRFRRDFDADFDGFKARYFTADTDYRCARQQGGRYLCEVEGGLMSAAVQVDVRRMIEAAEDRVSTQLTFAMSAKDVRDTRKQFVVDALSDAFTRAGHRVLMDGAVNAALARKRVDFGLGIYEVTFSKLDGPGAYDPYDLQLRGALTVRFRLTHIQTGRVLTNTPVAVTASEAGPYPATLKQKLVQDLSRGAAAEIARNVNAAVVSFDAERDANGRTR